MRVLSLLAALTVLSLTAAGCSGARYADAPALPHAALDYGFPTQTTAVQTAAGPLRLAYAEQGAGERTLLLVHGLASNAGFWRYAAPRFADAGYRVVLLDLPGFGKSAKPVDFAYSMEAFADVVARFVEERGLGPVTYVGHSMGGQIGLTLALERPDLVEDLVLAAPAGIEPFAPGEGAWLGSALSVDGIVNASEDAVRRNVALNLYRWDDRYEWLVEERVRMAKAPEMRNFAYAVTESVQGMLAGPTTARLPEIAVPTLIVYGRYDGLIPNPYLHPGTPRAVFEAGAEAIPGAQLVEIDDAGHLLQVEQPEAFVDAVAAFLSRRAGA
jgi:pimeloyl-ACP methyl ester carboxylesterase